MSARVALAAAMLVGSVACGGAAPAAAPMTQPAAFGASSVAAGGGAGTVGAMDAPAGGGDGRTPDDEIEARRAAAEPAPDGPFSAGRVKEIVRGHFDKVSACYEEGLARDPKMKGTIEVHLAIADDGFVVGATGKDSGDDALTDPTVVGCVETVFKRLRFPLTERGLVNLVYPVVLRVE